LPSTIEQVHQEFKDRGLTVLAIDFQEPREKVQAWVRDSRASFTVLLDPDGQVTRAYGVTATPTVFLVGRDGRLRGKAVGTRAWDSKTGRALLAALTRS
jgi:peroxiredoxin